METVTGGARAWGGGLREIEEAGYKNEIDFEKGAVEWTNITDDLLVLSNPGKVRLIVGC
jgi:hypothetical protein